MKRHNGANASSRALLLTISAVVQDKCTLYTHTHTHQGLEYRNWYLVTNDNTTCFVISEAAIWMQQHLNNIEPIS